MQGAARCRWSWPVVNRPRPKWTHSRVIDATQAIGAIDRCGSDGERCAHLPEHPYRLPALSLWLLQARYAIFCRGSSRLLPALDLISRAASIGYHSAPSLSHSFYCRAVLRALCPSYSGVEAQASSHTGDPATLRVSTFRGTSAEDFPVGRVGRTGRERWQDERKDFLGSGPGAFVRVLDRPIHRSGVCSAR